MGKVASTGPSPFSLLVPPEPPNVQSYRPGWRGLNARPTLGILTHAPFEYPLTTPYIPVVNVDPSVDPNVRLYSL